MIKVKAIYTLYPSVVSTSGSTTENLIAFDANGNQIEIDMDAINAWVDPEQYKYDRAAEYPPLADQLDYIYHNGVDAWKTDMIDPIKQKYPKPE
jgi:hypothetical protein